MNSKLLHRGPDGEGFYEEVGLNMAMRRLSIIDLTSGWQPLYNEDKSVVLMLNGEIYNYIELRHFLKTKSHQLKTEGDGEVIVHLYEEYGVKCLEHLRGMFAFALWDKKKKQLFIARDRMGEKPLYLHQNQNTLLFSSELRSLLASGLIDKQLDPFAIDLFFHYHYIPEPYTAIKGVRKLPAGHYLIVDQVSMKIEETCYWNMEDAPAITGNPIEIICEQLYELSKLVIRADVPVGVALSGGIDSSAVAALAVKHYKGNMHAFTIGYEGRPESDERHTAKRIADYLGMPFHEIELRNNDFVDNFPKICALTDDPIADISAFSYYSVSKAAREQGVPVLLQGQGGDELFWGYKWVREAMVYANLKKNLLANKANFFDYYKLKFGEKFIRHTLKKFTKGVLSIDEAYALYKKHKTEPAETFPFYNYLKGFNSDYTSIYGDAMHSSAKIFDSTLPFKVEQPWEDPQVTMTRLISQTYLLENGIAQGDRLSMANSVELRLPLVDYRLVETVIGLRKSYPDAHLSPKYWLNESVKDILPDWLFTLRKRGFEPPVELLFSLLKKQYGQSLFQGKLVSQGIIRKKGLDNLSKLQLFPSSGFPSDFSISVLEQWFNNIIEN